MELSDASASSQMEKLLSDQDLLSYHSMESQESVRLRHAHTADSRSLSASTEDSSGEAFIRIRGKDPIAQALDQCENWVLRPYRLLLKILGWTPFTRDGDSFCLKVVRGLLILFWLGVIIAALITQIISCFRRDIIVAGTSRDGEQRNGTNGTVNEIMCEEHLISSFILLDILLVASYIFPIYLFSRGETEYLSNLAEKVFVKNSQAKQGNLNKQLTWTMSFFFLLGVSWIILSFTIRILTALSVRLFTNHTIVSWSNGTFTVGGDLKLGLVVFSLVGFFFFDMLYVSAVMNHAAQSEMNIYLLRAIESLVKTKQYESLDTAIKDIMECRKYLEVLNGRTATATAFILFNLGSAAIVSLITLDEISDEALRRKALATVTSALNVSLWLALISFPFVQAARVTHAAEKLKETGPEIRARPMQYINTSQLELDSYLQLTQAVRLRASLFGVPIYPWMMYAVLVAFTFTMLLLFQFGVYSFTVYL